MIRKSLLLAVAAAATFGASMLMTSTADARGFGPGARGPSHGPSFSRANFVRHPGFHHHHHRHWHAHWRYPRIWYYPRPIYTGYAAAPLAAPVANTCNCLTKQYTQDPSNPGVNVVVFKDVCTGELAMNPPAQAPVQQSQAQ